MCLSLRGFGLYMQQGKGYSTIIQLLDFSFVQLLTPELDDALAHKEIKEADVGAEGTADQHIPNPKRFNL